MHHMEMKLFQENIKRYRYMTCIFYSCSVNHCHDCGSMTWLSFSVNHIHYRKPLNKIFCDCIFIITKVTNGNSGKALSDKLK